MRIGFRNPEALYKRLSPMLIKRIRAGAALNFIADNLEPAGEFADRETMLDHLRSMLEMYPSNSFYVFVVDDVKNEVVAFLLAFNKIDTAEVVGFQTWVKPGTADHLVQKMFSSLVAWCEANELSEIKMESRRHPEELLRRFSFKCAYKVYVRNLKEVKDDSANDELLYSDAGTEPVEAGAGEEHPGGSESTGTEPG